MDDARQFSEVSSALASFGVSPEGRVGLWRLLAAILHLGNVTFNGRETAEGVTATVADPTLLNLIAELLGTDPAWIGQVS